MLVRIESCRDSHLWYADHVGESFSLFEEDRDTFLVRAPDGYTNVVWREDAKKVPPSSVPHHGWGE